MESRSIILMACLLAASAAGADTIYKYRGADGKMTFSNRPVPNAELIEAVDYKFASPAARSAVAARSDAVGEKRILDQLAARDLAWNELQAATRALALAEVRLVAGVAPLEEEGMALGGPATPPPLAAGESPAPGILIPASPAVGGPQAPASPAVGGPQQIVAPPGQTPAQAAAAAAASRAVGGPMGTRRGGGRNADYMSRMAALEADVTVARARVDIAQRNYNQVR